MLVGSKEKISNTKILSYLKGQQSMLCLYLQDPLFVREGAFS